MAGALDRGMVLAMSIWDDHGGNMNWLDSTVPEGSTAPGAERGPCAVDAGDADKLEKEHKDAYVIYSNIRVGEIGSTVDLLPVEFLQ